MGFDEWMLGSALTVPGLLIVRLYTWSIGTITIGWNQRQESAIDWSAVGQTPVIRRITGGRAVYHDPGELTYSIALNPHAPARRHLGGSISRTSARFAEALQAFVERQGLSVKPAPRRGPAESSPDLLHKAPCFVSSARYELMAGDRKVVASAQRQVEGVILQHGSIKLRGVALHAALPGLSATAQAGVNRMVTAESWMNASEMFRMTMQESLKDDLEPGPVGAECENEVARAALRVQNDPLGRRPHVKQTGLANSL
jgi:lipoate-protein ligase A